jgi:hypothetical protein
MVIVVCDVCDQLPPGTWEVFAVAGRTFVVCGPCQSRPFRVPPAKPCMVVVGDVVHRLGKPPDAAP